MFDMFKGMGQIANLMRNLPKLQAEKEQLEQRLGQISVEGDAGAGMVKARFNGRSELVSFQLSEDALKLEDREMLEDLIKAAVNQGLARVRQQVTEETSKMMAGLGLSLPPGTNLPGMG